MNYDRVTLDIIQSSLQATSDEMFVAMRKTAMSAIIYEVLDMGTGITDATGNLVSSGAGIPSFIGVLDKAVKRIIELHGTYPAAIEPKDIFATNDPYYGGVTHLNDMVLAMPVFFGDRLIAWTANIAHWNDIGGMVPGSMSTEASSIFQEGLRIPAVKLVSRGQMLKPVMDIFKANSRLPDFLVGDLWAGVAAARIGERRILDLVRKYGIGTYLAALEHFMDFGEQVSLSALKSLPKGIFSYAETQDSGVVYKVVVSISAEEFIVDLRDNPPQDSGPYNSCKDGATIASQMLFKSLTDTGKVSNAGTFRPLKVLTKPGTVFDAQEPCAFGFYYEVEIRLYDLIWRCLAEQVPGILPSGHFASICGTTVGGPHPETGRPFTIVEPQVGGWGGSPSRDGNSAMFSGFHGETFNCPAEIAEARYGLYVDQMALSDEPGGEGRFRGGKGITVDYRVRCDDSFITCGYTRSVNPPWPLCGGMSGSPNYIEVLRKDGEVERYAVATNVRVDKDDVIRIHTGNGGGYGEPRLRPRLDIERDIRDGYLSRERAAEIYGYRGA